MMVLSARDVLLTTTFFTRRKHMLVLKQGTHKSKWIKKLTCHNCKAELMVFYEDLYVLRLVHFDESSSHTKFTCVYCDAPNEVTDYNGPMVLCDKP